MLVGAGGSTSPVNSGREMLGSEGMEGSAAAMDSIAEAGIEPPMELLLGLVICVKRTSLFGDGPLSC